MRMEAGLVERGRDMVGHVTRVGYVKKIITKRRRTRRIVRPPQAAPPMALQELFVSCLDVFKGPGTVPSPQDVQKLCHILDNMKPEDVGLSGDLQFFKPSNGVKSDPRVTSTTIYKCDNFSVRLPCSCSLINQILVYNNINLGYFLESFSLVSNGLIRLLCYIL
ncbi:hypothetical protein F2P56_007536, partial [Juglans regia]